MLTLTYEYKLKPTKQQIEDIENILIVCRKVWNYALRERKDWVNSRKCKINSCSLEYEYIIKADESFPTYHVQAKRLTEAKKTNPELKSVNAQVLQQVLRTLDRAWDDMKSRNFGFPRFKKHFRMKSFVFPQLKGEIIKANLVKLPQLGWVKFHQSRPIPDGFAVKQARVVRRASGYFVMLSLQIDVDIHEISFHGHPIGVDIGLESFLATSEGTLIARPKFFKSLQRKLELLQRRLRNKKLGSNNRKKLNIKIARLHQKISDTRKDFHFKTAHKICNQGDSIFVEDIDFRTWAKGMLGKHTLDAGFGQFFTILSYMSWKRGKFFGKVNKDGTSQTCPNCDAHTGKKALDIRIHSCPECGYTTNRDVAASQVIRNRGINEALRSWGFPK
ncbi:MAG: RNA-guided endonuclease InsQ/TnpB family protein [Nostoc sp. ZfuVER08]|jgi:putative transposase|uniref:Transposase n=1 Tax=Nostoc punctiforme FACHB-252 TaxID=1357509 RepID=A0ABR8H805_NOSPU|nr:RNA-guided endonuclease TnpB family protein [Nostoc punctiforme]MBD2611290.1 transposase [Nostoc punctiforme FACHB-252]MBL1199764.1 transposase [Nostoc sp. GBBB01]MDZ8015482.1 transposase [Nostoc sp. ZfuVER08]